MTEAQVKERLRKIRSGTQFGNIQLRDVREALTDEALLTPEGLLTANDNGSTLLHLAAQTKVVEVLPLVAEEYKKLKVFPGAMLKLNNKNMNPLHIAITASRYENVVLLFKECVGLCPEALQPNEKDEGWTLMHSAVQSPENLSIVKYLLSHDICMPMLLSLGRNPSGQQQPTPLLPLDLAKEQLTKNESYMRKAEMSSSRDAFSKQKLVDKCKELVSVVEQPTVELKVEKAKKLAEEEAEKKFLEMAERIKSELQELLLASNWETILNSYWLSERKEVQKITVRFLGERRTIDILSDTQLPQLSSSTLQVLLCFLDLEEDGATVKGALKLSRELTSSKENNSFILGHKDLQVADRVVHLLSSLDAEIQRLCADILLNISSQRPDNFERPSEDSAMVQTLLLVKHFSQDEEARRLASEVLVSLGVKRKQPDPGSWTVRQVSFWMNSNVELDQRDEFGKSFREANIDGLHLLELTSAEMTGLGVKFVSHQRKIASLIDGLRRMNMRSIVGHKDVFLSYAHININFARRLKCLLNEANYTVWIDEAGIRAGHKWRNEIADGIQGCSAFLFVMTPRSANSVYCQDEIALAEEYHKPIMTVRLEAVSEMDPGLKLIIQRRQWIDFMDESLFESNKLKLVEAVATTMGPGSGPDTTDSDEEIQHTSDQSSKHPDSEGKASDSHPDGEGDATDSGTAEAMFRDYLEKEIGEIRAEVRGKIQPLQDQVHQLQTLVEELSGRLEVLERKQNQDSF